MNSTEEMMSQEQMTEEKMVTADNQMDCEIAENKISKEDMLRGLLKNKMIVLDDEFTEASRTHTTCYNNDRFSTACYEAAAKCKLIQAKMDLVAELQMNLEEMLKFTEPLSMAV